LTNEIFSGILVMDINNGLVNFILYLNSVFWN